MLGEECAVAFGIPVRQGGGQLPVLVQDGGELFGADPEQLMAQPLLAILQESREVRGDRVL